MLAILAIGGCNASPTLPGGYTVSYGDRGKAWLQNPDGTMAHAGLIKRLHRDDKRILLVAYPVSYGGEAASPYPLDDTCYVALVVDGPTRRVRQIRLAEADRLAARMLEVESYERPCLEGMPNT
jgi:hypothetical protein